MHFQYILYFLYAAVVVKVGYILTQSFISPLRSVPGPLPARFTSLWYFFKVWEGHFEDVTMALHKRYGPVVRLTPNKYSIDSVEGMSIIYNVHTKYPKSDWYDGWRHPNPKLWTIFPLRDEKKHSDEVKKFKHLYSTSSCIHYEPYVNECIALLHKQLDKIVIDGRTANICDWFRYFTWDVIASITYAQRFGFLEQGKDVDGLISMIGDLAKYGTLAGIYAWTHPYIFPYTSKLSISGAGARLRLNSLLKQWMAEKKAGGIETFSEKSETDTGPQDFLAKMLAAHQKDPEKITEYHAFTMTLSNVTAGADTTAGQLSGLWHLLLKNAHVLEKLQQEIDEYESEGKLSRPITVKESQSMPYLQAVINEGLRLFTTAGLPLWREVPEGGVEIDGRFFPEGTEVGISGWVAHRNESVFPNAEAFEPERWLDAGKEGSEDLRRMEKYYMPFGLGSRTCLGRSIATLEMGKIIPELLRDYEFSLPPPKEQRFDTINYWFCVPVNLPIIIKRRRSAWILDGES